MPYKDIEKRREYARKMYYKHKATRKVAFLNLSEEEKEKVRTGRRKSHNIHYNNHKEEIKVKRRLTYNQVRLKSTYGITVEEYLNILERQDNKCALCESEKSSFKNMTLPLCVDHNHSTGQIRGLLCNKCNSMIGMVNENIEILEKAILYLVKWNKV